MSDLNFLYIKSTLVSRMSNKRVLIFFRCTIIENTFKKRINFDFHQLFLMFLNLLCENRRHNRKGGPVNKLSKSVPNSKSVPVDHIGPLYKVQEDYYKLHKTYKKISRKFFFSGELLEK